MRSRYSKKTVNIFGQNSQNSTQMRPGIVIHYQTPVVCKLKHRTYLRNVSGAKKQKGNALTNNHRTVWAERCTRRALNLQSDGGSGIAKYPGKSIITSLERATRRRTPNIQRPVCGPPMGFPTYSNYVLFCSTFKCIACATWINEFMERCVV